MMFRFVRCSGEVSFQEKPPNMGLCLADEWIARCFSDSPAFGGNAQCLEVGMRRHAMMVLWLNNYELVAVHNVYYTYHVSQFWGLPVIFCHLLAYPLPPFTSFLSLWLTPL